MIAALDELPAGIVATAPLTDDEHVAHETLRALERELADAQRARTEALTHLRAVELALVAEFGRCDVKDCRRIATRYAASRHVCDHHREVGEHREDVATEQNRASVARAWNREMVG